MCVMQYSVIASFAQQQCYFAWHGTIRYSADTYLYCTQIENRKLDINAQSKVGSLDNVKHKPGGGEIKIFDDKDYLKQRASGEHSSVLSGSQVRQIQSNNYNNIII